MYVPAVPQKGSDQLNVTLWTLSIYSPVQNNWSKPFSRYTLYHIYTFQKLYRLTRSVKIHQTKKVIRVFTIKYKSSYDTSYLYYIMIHLKNWHFHRDWSNLHNVQYSKISLYSCIVDLTNLCKSVNYFRSLTLTWVSSAFRLWRHKKIRKLDENVKILSVLFLKPLIRQFY